MHQVKRHSRRSTDASAKLASALQSWPPPCKAGHRPAFHRLDNECSDILKQFLQKEHIDYQLVVPGSHRRNSAKRAIRTWKNHFVAVQRSLDKEELEDYSLFISYSAGFALFVSLALIAVGLLAMLCLMTWQLWADRSSFTFPAYLLLLMVSTACLAWISAHCPYEKNHEEPPYNNVWGFLVLVPAIMFALVGLWLLLKNLPTPALYVSSFCFLVIPGLVLLAMYCKLMESSENLTYHGPMYIT
jgi:hypothetical protein